MVQAVYEQAVRIQNRGRDNREDCIFTLLGSLFETMLTQVVRKDKSEQMSATQFMSQLMTTHDLDQFRGVEVYDVASREQLHCQMEQEICACAT